MLKLILRTLFFVILGMLAYDFGQTGSFNKSRTYQFLREKGMIENAEVLIKELKISCDRAVIWAEINIPGYYNEAYVLLKPYLNLGKDLSLVFKSNVVSFTHHAGLYIDKNFPVFQNYVSILLKDTISSAKEGALVFSQHLQSYAESAVQYANKMLRQR